MRINHWGGSEDRSTKFLFKRRLARRRSPVIYAVWLGLLLAAAGGLAWGMRWAFNHPHFRVAEISVTGAHGVSSAEVIDVARSYLSGTEAFIVPRDQMFFLSSATLSSRIIEMFSKAKEVTVSKKFPDKIEIAIRERELWGLVCAPGAMHNGHENGNSEVLAKDSMSADDPDGLGAGAIEGVDACLLIDEDGFAFGALEGISHGVLPTIYADQGKNAPGRQVLEKKYIGYFIRARDLLSSKLGIDLVGLALENANPKDYKLIMAGDWYVLAARDTDPAAWIEQLKTLIAKKLDGREDGLEHVDLRFGNKVFYKLDQ